MILRTFNPSSLGSYLTSLFMISVGLLLLILSVGPKEGQCHCIGVHCSITSEGENIAYIQEAFSNHVLHVRQVKSENNVHKEGSSNGSLSVKYMEGEGSDKPKPKLNSDPKAGDENRATTLVLPPRPTENSNSQLNVSVDQHEDLTKSLYNLNTAALLRGFYVFGGLGAMVVMYILVRTIRLRRKKTTVRRYGILTNREDVEMTPLGADDDEDTTIFEMSPHART